MKRTSNKILIRIKAVLIFIILFSSCPVQEDAGKTGNGSSDIVIADYQEGTGEFFLGFNAGFMMCNSLGQSFKITSNNSCSKLKLYITGESYNPSSNYTVRIETDNSGSPSGILVNPSATAVKSAYSIYVGQWNEWIFSSNFSLSSNTTYWIVLLTNEPGGDSNGYKFRYDNTGSYTDGMMCNKWTGPWALYLDYDLDFILFQ